MWVKPLAVRGESPSWSISIWVTPKKAEGFRGRRSSHPVAAGVVDSLLSLWHGQARCRIRPVVSQRESQGFVDSLRRREPGIPFVVTFLLFVCWGETVGCSRRPSGDAARDQVAVR